ncbi:Dihaem cytochrome c [Desulfatibacillum alkenivorans DSM 16219]|uniref:Dihaem cytochrome c n=1 Tax=Desulfatibacillum alkenivorans DSM 16219 TaxID=1121393 RepID=A0A1M6N3K3_9BACT|nr:Dihaem cytochrome c [Desulfatibacillum alkenivorans DSM 16219]
MKKFGVLIAVCLGLLAGVLVVTAMADHHERDERHEKDRHRGDRGSSTTGVTNPAGAGVHADACGGCHFAYPPWLLPSGSWTKLLDNADDHFGETIDLSPEDLAALRDYLTNNAADRSGLKLSRKIMQSLSGDTPLRVTEVRYLIREHRDDDLPAGVFERASVGGMGNCIACHTGAANGDFDDDHVRIPK